SDVCSSDLYRDHDEEASRVVETIESAGGRAVALAADVADGQAARGLVTAAEASVGPLTALVNNAGIMPVTPFLDITPEEWDRVIATDLSAAFHTTQAVLPGMLDRGHGCIVNVSSRLGQIGMNNVVHYAAAKAGLLGFTKSLAREFGPRGIRVNAVAPGVTLTAMSTGVAEGEEGRRRLSELPAGRVAQAEAVAAAALVPLSDGAAMRHCP